MEQFLAAFGVDWRLLLAQAVNFGILLVALTYLLYKPVLASLDRRRALVAKGVEDAREAAMAKEQAETMAQDRLKSVEVETQQMVEQTRAFCADEKTRLLTEAQQQADRMEQAAALEAAHMKQEALRESEREITRLAILAAEKAIRHKSV